MDRRQFIFTGLAVAASASLGLTLWQQSLQPDADNRKWVLAALLPALLYGVLPSDPTLAQQQIARTQQAVTDFTPYLPLHQQQELDQLFNLLANRLGQLGLTGHLSGLPQLDIAQRLALLAQWRDSYLSLLQQAYHGLRELLYGAYYGQSEHWQSLSYDAPRFR